MSCIVTVRGVPMEGVVGDALATLMTTPYKNGKLVVAVSEDTDVDDPGSVYHAITTRADPAKDVIAALRVAAAWPALCPITGG